MASTKFLNNFFLLKRVLARCEWGCFPKVFDLDFEAELWFMIWGWNLVKILKLKFCRFSDAEFSSAADTTFKQLLWWKHSTLGPDVQLAIFLLGHVLSSPHQETMSVLLKFTPVTIAQKLWQWLFSNDTNVLSQLLQHCSRAWHLWKLWYEGIQCSSTC